MKHFLVIDISFSFFLINNLYSQSNISLNQASLSVILKSEARKMGNALIAGDYKTFATYTYPAIVKVMGGENKMAELLSKTTASIKAQGMSFSKISFGEPLKMIRSGKELQTTILQHLEIQQQVGKIVSTSTLIAISADNGVHWTFIDTSNRDIATLRKLLPNISPSITIPLQQPPARI